jgi:glycosyltransferase involved in cell wall biosynthesis
LVNLEAMAARKPVVATCFGGAPEIVVDGEAGYIVDPRDTKVFAAKVVELLQNPAKARQFGEAGHRRLLEHFTAERMAQEYLGAYTRQIGRQPG